MNIGNFIKLVLTFLTTYIGYFLGGFDTMLGTLLIFIVIDYLTGILVAIYNKNLSSSVGFKGICKKVIIVLMVGIATRLEIALGLEEIRYVVISFYLANEGISILENAALIGVPIPRKIISILDQIKETNNLEESE